MLCTKMHTLWAGCLMVFLFTGLGFRSRLGQTAPFHPLDTGSTARVGGNTHTNCRTELETVRKMVGATPDVAYARACLKAMPMTDLDISTTTRVNRSLLSIFGSFESALSRCEGPPPCDDPILIEYTNTSARGLGRPSQFLIGAATTIERFDRSLVFMARWLAHTDTTIIVRIHGNVSQDEMESLREKAHGAGIRALLMTDPEDQQQADITELHFRIVEAMQEVRESHHKWFVIIDDDTFITSLSALETALEPFDPASPWYIGALTESWPQLQTFGYMAYGGAGIILSSPVLGRIIEHMEECLIVGGTGDGRFKTCLYSVVSPPVQLTLLPGLNQIDIRGNPDGWYESGRKPILNIHHYDGWHHVPLQYGHMITEICGHDCFLQRYLFQDDVVFTNGYSVAKYSIGLGNVDLGRIENTFEEGDYDFSFGRTRPKLSRQDKTSWKLEYGIKSEDGSVMQFYVERDFDGDGPARSVIEMVWVAH